MATLKYPRIVENTSTWHRRFPLTSGPRNLTELRDRRHNSPPWLLDLVLPEVGGGKFHADRLALIDENSHAQALRISGLDQPTFERLISDYGHRFKAIEFWKCPKIEDLTPLEDLPDVQMLSLYWNQKSRRLWNLRRTPHLKSLCFEDFIHLQKLDDLQDGTEIEELEFGDAIWPKSTWETLDPLAALFNLRSLGFFPKRIMDGRIQPLAALLSLDALAFPANLFTTEQVAWLRARLPDTVTSDMLAPVVTLKDPLDLDGKLRDVLLIGKRKPYLSSDVDGPRIRKHIEHFESMVSRFRDGPSLEPAPTR